MKKFSALLTALTLVFVLCVPALAADFEELGPPLWRALGFDSREEYMQAEPLSAEEYIAQTEWMRSYLAAHPEEARSFDAEDYYVNGLWDGMPLYPRQVWIDHARPGYADADFRAEMKARWLAELWRDHRARLHWDALVTLYPEDFAAFDADAWFAGYLGGRLGYTKEEYRARERLASEDEFRRSLFADCADGTCTRGACAVAVNGTPLDFYPAENAFPMLVSAEDGWTFWVPARAVGQALGYTVVWDAGSVSFTRGDRIAVFTPGRADYTVNGGPLSLSMPAWVEGNRLYLPMPQLADALDCAWSWNSPHSAVFLRPADQTGLPPQ